MAWLFGSFQGKSYTKPYSDEDGFRGELAQVFYTKLELLTRTIFYGTSFRFQGSGRWEVTASSWQWMEWLCELNLLPWLSILWNPHQSPGMMSRSCNSVESFDSSWKDLSSVCLLFTAASRQVHSVFDKYTFPFCFWCSKIRRLHSIYLFIYQ